MDMIPLIDISLVLLIFFMMTMTVAAISRIQVPDDAQRLRHSNRTRMSCGSTSTSRDGQRVYALGIGTSSPAPEDDNLGSDVELIDRLDARLRTLTEPPQGPDRGPRRLPY